MRAPFKYEKHVLSSKASCHRYASHETFRRGPKFAGTECRKTVYISLWIGTWHGVSVVVSRLEYLGEFLCKHQKTFDLGRETERCERGKPAPVLDEVEPDAMAMGDGVSVGEWWRRCFPWPSASPRSVGGVGGSDSNAMNLVSCARPPPLYIALPRGPTNHILVGRPRSGRERGSGSSRWTRS
jgi:hypothetical protein